jgi:hypothetical protein
MPETNIVAVRRQGIRHHSGRFEKLRLPPIMQRIIGKSELMRGS